MSEVVELVYLTALWGGVALLGGLVGYYSLKAWRSSRERTFGYLGAGILACSVAASVSWIALYLMGENLWVCETGSTGFMLAGFAVILYAVRSPGA